MGASRKKLRPPIVAGPTSPTAPVSQKLRFSRPASDAATAEIELPWLPSTTDTPRRRRADSASGTASAREASTVSRRAGRPLTPPWALAHSTARVTPRSSSVPPVPWVPDRG